MIIIDDSAKSATTKDGVGMKPFAIITMLIVAALLLAACDRTNGVMHTTPPGDFRTAGFPEKEVRTVTIEVPYIPWEMPWVNGDIPSAGERATVTSSPFGPDMTIDHDGGLLFVSHDGNEPMITLEIEVVDSLVDVPFRPGGRTVVTDGELVLIIDDELDQSQEQGVAYRYAYVYDFTQPFVCYGALYIYARVVWDGATTEVTQHLSNVSNKPNHSDLAIIDTSVFSNHSDKVSISSHFAVTRDDGSAWVGGIVLNLGQL